MRDNCPLEIDCFEQIADHPVGRQWSFFRIEFWLPFGEPLVADGCDLRRNRGCTPPRFRVQPVAHLGEQRFERETGVAKQRIVDRDVLGEVGRVECRLDDGRTGRHRNAVPRLGEAASDAEDQIGVVEEMADSSRDRASAGAERKRVVFRERALTLETRRDRRLQQLGERVQGVPGFRIVNALPGIDDRPLGLDERLSDPRDICRDRRRPALAATAGSRPGRACLRTGRRRDLDQCRPRTAVARLREGTAHRVRDHSRQYDLLARLRDVLEVEIGVELRRHVDRVSWIPCRQHDDWGGVRIRLRDAAECVLGARPVLHRENADGAAGGDAADGVRHMEPGAFLADDDGADIGRGRGLDDRVDRVADQELDTLSLQDFRYRRRTVHRLHALLRCLSCGGHHHRRLPITQAVAKSTIPAPSRCGRAPRRWAFGHAHGTHRRARGSTRVCRRGCR